MFHINLMHFTFIFIKLCLFIGTLCNNPVFKIIGAIVSRVSSICSINTNGNQLLPPTTSSVDPTYSFREGTRVSTDRQISSRPFPFTNFIQRRRGDFSPCYCNCCPGGIYTYRTVGYRHLVF
jgi:hypothetical protein